MEAVKKHSSLYYRGRPPTATFLRAADLKRWVRWPADLKRWIRRVADLAGGSDDQRIRRAADLEWRIQQPTALERVRRWPRTRRPAASGGALGQVAQALELLWWWCVQIYQGWCRIRQLRRTMVTSAAWELLKRRRLARELLRQQPLPELSRTVLDPPSRRATSRSHGFTWSLDLIYIWSAGPSLW